MTEETNEFDYIMKSPEGLFSVRIEASTIREVLLELHTKIENLNKRMIDFLKSREINQLQEQIDQINTKIESIEQQGVETPATPTESNAVLSESVERKIEESKFLLDQSLRNFIKKSLDELKTNFNQSLTDANDTLNVANSMKYATIQMYIDLQQHIEDLDSKFQILNSNMNANSSQNTNVNAKAKKIPTSEKLSSCSSSAKTSGQSVTSNISTNLDPSPPNSASQNARISKMSTKLAVLESAFNTINTIIDQMKQKINDVEKASNGNSKSIEILEEKIEGIQNSLKSLQSDSDDHKNNINNLMNQEKDSKQYTQPETIIKTIPQEIDLENMKFEVVQSVLDQVMPFLKEYLEKVENSQDSQSPQKADDDKKNNSFSISDQQGITESQKEIVSSKEASPSESNTPSQSKSPPSESNTSSQSKSPPEQTRAHRDFSSFMANRLTSPRGTKPSLADPRVSACERQLKALKESVNALENAMRSQFGLVESRVTELLLRTSAIEKCLEDKGEKLEKIEKVEPVIMAPIQSAVAVEERPEMGSTGCQTVEDDVGVMVDLDAMKKEEREGEGSEEKNKEEQNKDLNANSVENDRSSEKVASSPNKTIIKPSVAQRPSTVSSSIRTTSPHSDQIKKEDLQLVFGTPLAPGSSARGTPSSRNNLSSRSHLTSQTYEDLDSLTKRLEAQVKELTKQMQNTTERLGEEDRQIHALKKSLGDGHITRADLDELRAEIEERDSFNRKNNPNGEAVTAFQLKRVVSSFQNSIKALDKQLEAVTEKVPSFISRDDLTELVEAVTQLSTAQTKEKMSATAGGTMAYRCLLCGRPTNQVTGMITEGEVARMIGEPPIIGASAVARGGAEGEAGHGNELVLMYGKEGSYNRATSQMSVKRKKMPVLPKITPKTPNLPVVTNNGNNSNGA